MSKFEVLQHGRYSIKVGPLAGAWAAQALQGAKLVGLRHQASTRDEALAKATQALDEREETILRDRGADGAPSSLEFAEAFGRLGKLPPSYDAMLQAHLQAPGHRLTASQLAKAAGYENFNAANLHYGKLGQMLAEELNFNPPRRGDGTVIWTATLATWSEWQDGAAAPETSEESGHFEWTMRPQVVQALQGFC